MGTKKNRLRKRIHELEKNNEITQEKIKQENIIYECSGCGRIKGNEEKFGSLWQYKRIYDTCSKCKEKWNFYINFIKKENFKTNIYDFFIKNNICSFELRIPHEGSSHPHLSSSSLKYFWDNKINLNLINKMLQNEDMLLKKSDEIFEISLLENELQEKLEKTRIEKDQKENQNRIKKLIKIFTQKAIDNNFTQNISRSHIKFFATQIGEDVKGNVEMMAIAVSENLKKMYGEKFPKKRKIITSSLRIEVLKRDKYRCVECGNGKEFGLDVHHIIPDSRGGTDEMWNLATLCSKCNGSISNRKIHPMKSWIGYKIYDEWKENKKIFFPTERNSNSNLNKLK